MDIDAMVGAVEGLTDEQKSALRAKLEAEQANIERLETENRQAKASRDEARSKQKERADEIAKLQAQIDALEGKDLPEIEKLQREREKIASDLEKASAALEAEKQAHASALRTHEVDRVHGSINWNRDAINDGGSRVLIGNALAEVDLSDEAAVKAAVDAFTSSNKGLIAAEIKGGAGSRPSAPSAPAVVPGDSDLINTVRMGSLEEAQAAVDAATAATAAERTAAQTT